MIDTNYYIEYQLNGTTSNWTKATTLGESITVSNLNHNDIVYARRVITICNWESSKN